MSMMNGVSPHLLPKVPGCCCDGMMYNYGASPPSPPVYPPSRRLMYPQDILYKQPYVPSVSRKEVPEDLWRQAERTPNFYGTEDASVPIRTFNQGVNVSLNSMQEATGMMYNYGASPPSPPVYPPSRRLMYPQDILYKQPYVPSVSRKEVPEDLWRQAERTPNFYGTEDASVPIRTFNQGVNVSLNSMQEATGQPPNGSSTDMSHFPTPLPDSTHGIRSPRRNALKSYGRRNHRFRRYRGRYNYMSSGYSKPYYLPTYRNKGQQMYRRRWPSSYFIGHYYRHRQSSWKPKHAKVTPVPPIWQTPAPIWQTPAPIWQTHVPFWQTPAPFWQTPAPIWQTPAPIWQTPAPIWQTPAPIWPAKTTTVTTSTTTKSTTTTTTTPKPTTTTATPKPTTTTPKPTTTTTTPKPTTTTPKPTTTTTTPKPTTTTTTPKPTTTTPKPTTTTTTPKPTTTTPKPTTTTTTPKPTTTTTTPKPTTTTTTPKPTTTTTTPKPTTTTTTPKPTTTTPKPTTTTTTPKPTTTTTTPKPTTTTTTPKPTTTTTTPKPTTTTTTPKPTTTTTTPKPTTTTTKATTPTTTTTTPTTSTTKKTTTTVYTSPTTTIYTPPTTTEYMYGSHYVGTTTTPSPTTTPTTTTTTPTTTTSTNHYTTTTTTTPTTTPSTYTTMSEPACDYSVFSKYHVRIPETNKHCVNLTKRRVSEADQKEILEMHNTYRQEVAKGENKPQPKAANMQVLKWNQELADNAQSIAESCQTGYVSSPSQLRVCSRDYNVSENRFYLWSPDYKTKDWTEIIDSWYNQGTNLSTSIFLDPDFNNTREYSQLVWANAYEVGCGGAYIEPGTGGISMYYFCLYGPGIVESQPLYRIEETATGCNGPVSSTYSGLCESRPTEKESHEVEPPFRTSLTS
ncbi:hypothetical protein Pcinc_002660 [Petrolisthes cinctipes]|uniref:SCP domain-containing protein n=1 Tax=Petrolisthes cinctipes TaxID=88211 RepID=A0AAE1GIU7_PETCI|nr:hypothetical protein Pcinc_002660 [Petrolisthes cinctipes]